MSVIPFGKFDAQSVGVESMSDIFRNLQSRAKLNRCWLARSLLAVSFILLVVPSVQAEQNVCVELTSQLSKLDAKIEAVENDYFKEFGYFLAATDRLRSIWEGRVKDSDLQNTPHWQNTLLGGARDKVLLHLEAMGDLERRLEALDTLRLAINQLVVGFCGDEVRADTGDTGFGTLPDPSDGSTPPGGNTGTVTDNGGSGGRLKVANPESTGDAWQLRVVGTMTLSYLREGAVYKTKDFLRSINWVLGDDGTLHTATLHFHSDCRLGGTASLDGDKFNLKFTSDGFRVSGPVKERHGTWEVDARGVVLQNFLDAKSRTPATVEASIKHWNADGDLVHTATFVSPIDGEDHFLQRINVSAKDRVKSCGSE